MRTAGWKIAGALCFAALGACAQAPDFAAPRPGLVQRIDTIFASDTIAAPVLPMTAAERDLRGLAANLAVPTADADDYQRLRARTGGSAEGLIDAIAADADTDTAGMERFAGISQTVVEADRMRARNLQTVPPGAAEVRARIGENGRIIEDTGNALAARLIAYRRALGRARIDAPDADRLAVLEGAIERMAAQLALMDRNALAHNVIVSDLNGGPSKG
ncbi:MAG TPA: hypothetical protein VF449_03895 [Parvibaculum sp.]